MTKIQNLLSVDRVVHEPARLMILKFLESVGEADFTYLQAQGGFTQGNLATHLTKLRDAGYVDIEKTYKGRVPLSICRLTPAGRNALKKYVRSVIDALGAPS